MPTKDDLQKMVKLLKEETAKLQRVNKQRFDRIIELEDKFIQADTHIEDLLAKHEAEEAEKRVALEEQIKFYEKEFNINPLSWGKRKKKK